MISKQLVLQDNFRRYWTSLFNNAILPPSDRTLILWAMCFSEEAVERGIQRAARKYFKSQKEAIKMTEQDAQRYATSVMRRVSDGEGDTKGERYAVHQA